jgi:hypothetical protein
MAAKENKKTEEAKYDLRVIERHLREGLIEKKEYDDFLKRLPDDEANADYSEIYEEGKPTSKSPPPGGPTFTSG